MSQTLEDRVAEILENSDECYCESYPDGIDRITYYANPEKGTREFRLSRSQFGFFLDTEKHEMQLAQPSDCTADALRLSDAFRNRLDLYRKARTALVLAELEPYPKEPAK